MDTGKVQSNSKEYRSQTVRYSSNSNNMISYAPSFKELHQKNLILKNEKVYEKGGDDVVDLLFAFDFDGVICNSAKELCISGWEAGKQLYGPNITADWPAKPSNDLISKFHQVRPVVETGWDAIIINRALMEGEPVHKFLSYYSSTFREELIAKYRDPSSLLSCTISIEGQTSIPWKQSEEERYKKAFHEARTNAIETNREEWLEENDFYPRALEVLRYLNDLQKEQERLREVKNKSPLGLKSKHGQIKVVIITTKAKEFTLELLAGKGIDILEKNVFGLGSGKKVDVLHELLEEMVRRNTKIGEQKSVQGYFIEDRLLTLQDVMKNENVMHRIQLLLAGWGYNTDKDRQEAKEKNYLPHSISSINSTDNRRYPIHVLESESDLEDYIL